MLRAVTFDLYGTLVDWRASIGSFISYVAGAEYIDEFFQCDLESVGSAISYRPYSEILTLCLKRVLSRAHKHWRNHYGEAIALAFAKSPPFPDTLLGLLTLKSRGVLVAIISNTEKKLVRVTLAGLESLVDMVVTAEDIGVYKPSKEAFIRAYKLLGIEFGEAIHVSSYPQYDLEPARSLGIRAVHLNRYGYTWEPSIGGLEELVDLIGGL